MCTSLYDIREMKTKFVDKINKARQIDAEARNDEKTHENEIRDEAIKTLIFWQSQDVKHDYRETTAFDNELNYAVKSLIQ